MKSLILHLCLLAVLFQAISASTFPDDAGATLEGKFHGSIKAKRVVNRLAKKKRSLVVRMKAPLKPFRKKRGVKRNKRSVIVKKGKPKSLNEILPAVLVEIVLGYFKDTYSILVSAHSWLLTRAPEIAVDSVRLYVVTYPKGLKGLNHSSASLKKGDRRCIEFGDPQWFDYGWFKSSNDGRCVSFSHSHKLPTDFGEQSQDGIKWLMQSSKLEDGRPKRVIFDDENSSWGLLSRDGQTLCSYNIMTDGTRVYQIKEEAGKDPVAVMKFELNGKPRAVSGNNNRVMMENAGQLEVHDIDNGANKLACQIKDSGHVYALNGDGSEAAYVSEGNELRIMQVNEVVESKVEQPAVVSVKVPESMGTISKLVYDDENKLHVLHKGGSVSLFDPPMKTFVPIRAPQEEQRIVNWVISPNADYIAALKYAGRKKESKKSIYRTIVRRKLRRTDL